MPQASDYDRYYRVLGLQPGGSLAEIEASWKRLFAAFHPDKFGPGARETATIRAQEINNARDELRRHWRRYGKPPPSGAAYEPRITRPEPPEPEPGPPPSDPISTGRAAPPQAAARSIIRLEALWPQLRTALSDAPVLLFCFIAVAAFALLQAKTHEGARIGTARRGPPAIAEPAAPALAAQSPSLREPDEAAGRAAADVQPRPATFGPSPSEPAPDQSADTSSDDAAATLAPGPPVVPGATPAEPEQTAPSSVRESPPAEIIPRAAPGEPAGARPASAAAEPSGKPLPHRTTPKAVLQDRKTRFAAVPAPPTSHNADATAAPSAQSAAAFARIRALRQAAAQACRGDLRTLCAGVRTGEGRIVQCLRQHFSQVSSSCSGALLAARVAIRQAQSPRD